MSTSEIAPILDLQGAGVSAKRGTVFGPLSTTSARPVTVVRGTTGTGRTSLLLSIAGRMRLTEGALSTLGESGLSSIRERVGIVGFAEIDALEPAVTLGATLRERLSWAMPWYRRTPRMTDELAADLLGGAFGETPLPAHEDLVRELNAHEQMLVRIALALIDGPEMLVVDDFDALRDPSDRALVAGRLNALAANGMPIVLATSDPGDVGLFAEHDPAVIEL
ncbi:ATP-binding cassette domain-containing protein [Leucobacter sp. GX0328]